MDIRAKILIVDDHRRNVEILVDLLKKTYELATAGSGEEAIELARTFRPDLVLLDNMMPGMNGYEACRELRKLPGVRRAKILMVSARAMPAERMEGYEAGADDYIAKPFDHDELLAKIRVYIRLKSAEEIGSLRSNLITLLQHETRTPMAVLAGALETLKTCLPLDSFATQSMRMAEAAAEQLHRLHERIVMLSKLRSGYSTLRPIATDIAVLVRQCAASRDSAATRAQVRLTCRSVDGAWARFDPEYTNSVFGELLDNAVRYTPAGGEVRIDCAREGAAVTIRVMDTGSGIPAEALSTIMDEFVVGDIRHHRRGTGLGLAIVRELLAGLNGAVAFESVENRGTTVVLTFPATEPQSLESPGSESEDRAA